MMNFRGEEKKCGGASKVVLTGDRFLTCFPSHLLWVKAHRQSRICGRESEERSKTGDDGKAAGTKGNIDKQWWKAS